MHPDAEPEGRRELAHTLDDLGPWDHQGRACPRCRGQVTAVRTAFGFLHLGLVLGRPPAIQVHSLESKSKSKSDVPVLRKYSTTTPAAAAVLVLRCSLATLAFGTAADHAPCILPVIHKGGTGTGEEDTHDDLPAGRVPARHPPGSTDPRTARPRAAQRA